MRAVGGGVNRPGALERHIEGISAKVLGDRLKQLSRAGIFKRRQFPEIPPRVPPIRFRKRVPDCWIGLELIEGKNRQVRRMTAAIGHPTLRLIRVRIGGLKLGDLAAGKWKILSPEERKLVTGE